MARIALLLVLVVGCGSVTAKEGADAAAGTGGQAAAGGAGGELGGRAGSAAGAGGVAATGCLDNNTPGFEYNPTCDGGAPSSAGCHAGCVLNGKPFVGCTNGGSGLGSNGFDYSCYASCSSCP